MTSILGTAQTTPAAAEAWAAGHGMPADLAALAGVYWKLGPARGGVRPEVGFAQFCKETGFGRFGGTDTQFSATAAMCNPAGLKSADGKVTVTFPDWWTGITAQLDHLALYAGATGYPRAGSPDQRAFPFIRGACLTVEALGGHWAPAADYGTSLVADYLNPMLTTPAAPGGPVTLYPAATQKPVVNHSGPRTGHLGFVVHVQVGDGSCYAEFDNPAAQASSHFWISKTGAVEQFVDTSLVAWAEMAGNGDYISCEFEGFTTEAMTEAQLTAGAALIAWCAEQDGFPLTPVDHGGTGVTTHCHYPSGVADPSWGDHSCPGPIRLGQIPELIAMAQAGGSTPIPPAPAGPAEESNMVSFDPVTGGFWVARPDGSVEAFDGAPYLGGLNNHPQWHAGTAAGGSPCVGIAPFGAGGQGGYVLVADSGTGIASPYRMPRSGTYASS